MPPRVGRFRGIAATPATRWRGAQVTRPKLGRPEQWPSNAETSGVNAVMRKALSPALDDAPVGLAVDREPDGSVIERWAQRFSHHGIDSGRLRVARPLLGSP